MSRRHAGETNSAQTMLAKLRHDFMRDAHGQATRSPVRSCQGFTESELSALALLASGSYREAQAKAAALRR